MSKLLLEKLFGLCDKSIVIINTYTVINIQFYNSEVQIMYMSIFNFEIPNYLNRMLEMKLFKNCYLKI